MTRYNMAIIYRGQGELAQAVAELDKLGVSSRAEAVRAARTERPF